MSAVLDLNGNTIIDSDHTRNADAWARRNRDRLTGATIDGASEPLLMVSREDGHCYRVRCGTIQEAHTRAERLGLTLDTTHRGTDFDV